MKYDLKMHLEKSLDFYKKYYGGRIAFAIIYNNFNNLYELLSRYIKKPSDMVIKTEQVSGNLIGYNIEFNFVNEKNDYIKTCEIMLDKDLKVNSIYITCFQNLLGIFLKENVFIRARVDNNFFNKKGYHIIDLKETKNNNNISEFKGKYFYYDEEAIDCVSTILERDDNKNSAYERLNINSGIDSNFFSDFGLLPDYEDDITEEVDSDNIIDKLDKLLDNALEEILLKEKEQTLEYLKRN